MSIRLSKLAILFLTTIIFTSCEKAYFPRPYGYFRVDLPNHEYATIDTLSLPYKFDKPIQAKLIQHNEVENKYWIDIFYPQLNATLYCSYKPVNGNLFELLEDSRKMVYKHSIRADGIEEKIFQRPEKKVHGILYELKGNAASTLQFSLTDSTKHFFRGSLYFNNVPNKDSIAPMLDYVRLDVIRLIESFEWKK